MKFCFQNALTPALSHPMGEGESHVVPFEFVSTGFARRSFAMTRAFACYPPLRVGGVCGAGGERAGVRCTFHHLSLHVEGSL